MKVEIITVSDAQLTTEMPEVEAKHAARTVVQHALTLTGVTTSPEDEEVVADTLWGAMGRADAVMVIGEIQPGKGVILPAVSRVTGRRLAAENPGITGAAVLGMPGEFQRYALMFQGLSSIIILLPKNPRELAFLLDNEVIQYLQRDHSTNTVARWGILRSAGVMRSMLEERLRDLTLNARQRLHFATFAGRTDIRVWVEADSVSQAETELTRLMRNVRARLGDQIYGNGTDRLEMVLYDTLVRNDLTLVLAEVNSGAAIAREWRELATSTGPVKFAATKDIDEALERLQDDDELMTASCRRIADELRTRYGTDLCLLVYCNVNPGGIQVFVSLANDISFSEEQVSYGGHPKHIAEAAATRGLSTLRRWLISNNKS